MGVVVAIVAERVVFRTTGNWSVERKQLLLLVLLAMLMVPMW